MIKVKVTLKYATCDIRGVKFRAHVDGRLERWISNRWREVKGNPNQDGHLRVDVKYRYVFFHRIVYQAFNPTWDIEDCTQLIDHIDRNKLNNAISNLRIVTVAENTRNRTRRSDRKWDLPKNIHPEYRSNIDGWYWSITVNVDGKKHSQYIKAGDGPIPDPLPPLPQEVIDVRNQFVKQHHGSFAA